MLTIRRCCLFVVAIVLLFSNCFQSVRADTIDVNSFTYRRPPGGPQFANDFRLTISGTFAGTQDPRSDQFPNVSVNPVNPANPGMQSARFSGNQLATGNAHTVGFRSTGNNPMPMGQFTDINGMDIPGAMTRSRALDNTLVSFVPMGGGFDTSLSLLNGFGSALAGTVNVYLEINFLGGVADAPHASTSRAGY